MKKVFILPLLACSFYSVFSQGIKIKGCVRDMPYTKVFFAEILSGKMSYLDSTVANNGCFDFYEPDTLEKGMYSIVLNKVQNAYIRIILNNEKDIEFNTSYDKTWEDMNFTKSAENKLFYAYNKTTFSSSEKSDLIQKLLNRYPGDSKLAKDLKAELITQNNLIRQSAAGIEKDHPKTMAAVFIKAQDPVTIPAGMDTIQYLRDHLLDQLNFNSTALMRSGMLASGILKYLSLYENKDYTYKEQVENYATALGRILQKAAVNDTIYGFYRNELTNRYRYGNYDILGAYLLKYYPEKRDAISIIDPSNVRTRLSSLNHVSQGVQAPDIQMPTYDGKTSGLADIHSDYTLLVFWSTGCFHCTEMLPELKKIYDRQRGHSLEVLAVSFDTDKTAWQDFIKKGNFSWINYSDLKGWQSDIAKTYDIQGTPTYILLDKGKTVIYKPATLEELFTKLHALNVI